MQQYIRSILQLQLLLNAVKQTINVSRSITGDPVSDPTCFSKAAGTRRLSSVRLLLMRSLRRFSITCPNNSNLPTKLILWVSVRIDGKWGVELPAV